MSTRERWIVYPLLFMTLGIVLRDKILPSDHHLVDEVAARRIEAGEIVAQRILCKDLKAIQADCRVLLVTGPNGRPAVIALADPKSQAGTIDTFNAAGMRQVSIRSTDAGGLINAYKTGPSPSEGAKQPPDPGKASEEPPPKKMEGTKTDKPG